MSAIRPDLPSFAPSQTTAPGSAAREAQAAFFRAALGQGTATQTATATPAAPNAVVAQITPTSTRASSAPDPDRPLRPGSLLDIRI